MSSSFRRSLLLAILLIGAAACQCVFAVKISIHGARPDLVLMVALLGSLFFGANESAGIGFCAGVLTASCAAPPAHFDGYGSIVVSRVIVGWLEERVFRDNFLIALAIVAGGTLLAEACFFAFDPHFRPGPWLHGILLETVYNSTLCIPVYYLARLCLKRPQVLISAG